LRVNGRSLLVSLAGLALLALVVSPAAASLFSVPRIDFDHFSLGAGFGGATVSLCDRDRAREIGVEISERYALQSGIPPRVFVCDIADGAA